MAAPRGMLSLALAAAMAGQYPAVGVQQQDPQDFFSSAKGLSMSAQEAASLATKEVKFLTRCGVTVPMLQALKDTMSSPSALDLAPAEVRHHLLPLAYQHASPAHLGSLYQALYNPQSVGLPKADAQQNALALASQHAEPYLLGPLYEVLSGASAVGLPKKRAQQMAIDLTAAGADAGKLKDSFQAAKSRMSEDAALTAAVADAVDANLYGLATRYAKDGKAYVAKVFQSYYGTQWLAEWQAGVPEKRTAPDGKDYRASEFLEYYGGSWSSSWKAAPVAEQRRIARDGKEYTMQEFQSHYGAAAWQAEWQKSYEVLDTCAGLNHATCDAQASKCQWKWTGDWTTSCVVKPRPSAPCAGLNHAACDAQAPKCQWKWTGDWTTSCVEKPHPVAELVV